MAPLSQEVQTISSCVPPHLGPAVSEVTSVWFKLWLYSKLGTGPHSILLSRGTRLRRLPLVLKVITLISACTKYAQTRQYLYVPR